jgi:hypothetical protein
MNLNEELLSEDPDSQAVEVDDDAYYEPFPDEASGVVVTEPDIITIGRGLRKDALKKERDAMREMSSESS